MFKPTQAQQYIIDRLAAGTHIISCNREWFQVYTNSAGELTNGFTGYKANSASLDVLIREGIVMEFGEINTASYRVELIATETATVDEAPAVEAAPAAKPAAKSGTGTVTRVTSVNRSKIESDARTGLPDDTAFDLTNAGTLIVNSGPFAGMYRVVKVKSPRWIGDNGYTFERDLNAADTIVLNVAYDLAGVKTSTEARERHFARLVDLIVLNSPPVRQPKQTIIIDRGEDLYALAEELAEQSRERIEALETEAAYIAAAQAKGLYVVRCRRCETLATTYEAVDSIWCFCGSRYIEVSIVYSPPVEEAAQYTPGTILHAQVLHAAYGFDKTVDYINNKMTPAAAHSLAVALQCKVDGREIVNAINALMAEAKAGVVGSRVYIASIGKTLEVLDYAPKTNVVIVSPRYAGKDDRQGFTLGTEAVIVPPAPTQLLDAAIAAEAAHDAPAVQSVVQQQQTEEDARARRQRQLALAVEFASVETEAEPTPAKHKDRQRVIDRALAANHIVKDADVEQSNTLREVALDFVKTYRGTSSFVQSVAVWLADKGHISTKQMRGALNVMIAEAREERAAKAEAARQTSADDVYMDLRGRKERAIDDAGDAVPPADESANEVALAIPNGYYTVIINDAADYRTLRVGDCPTYFTVKPGTQLISYLSGPENTADYVGFAFLAGRTVSIWSKHRNASDLRIAADRLVADPMTGASAYVKRSSRCFVCNHVLTTPESIARGIGPKCAESVEALGYSFNLMGNRDEAIEQVTLEQAQCKPARERARKSCEACLGTGETPDDDLADELGLPGVDMPCYDCMPQAYAAKKAQLTGARAIDTQGINGAFTSKTTKQERLSGARAALARIAADNEARKALDAELNRQRAASGPITRERALADIDELFD